MNKSMKIELALRNAIASSAIEGLPLTEKDIATVKKMLNGELSVNDYVNSVKTRRSKVSTEDSKEESVNG